MRIRRLQGWRAAGAMLLRACLALFGASTVASAESFLPITTEVNFGETGPFRFLVDTGTDVTLMEPELATELGLKPGFRMELVSPRGSQIVPGTLVNTLRLGGHSVPPVSILFQNLVELKRSFPGVRGILGADVLAHFAFSLFPRTGELELTASRPPGAAIPFSIIEGHIVIKGRMGKELLSLALDSGASGMVFFHMPSAMASSPRTVGILTGIHRSGVTAVVWTRDLVLLHDLHVASVPAAIIDGEEREIDGLLPACIFTKIFVDWLRHEAVLVR